MEHKLRNKIRDALGILIIAFIAFHAIGYFLNEGNNEISLRKYRALCKEYPNIDANYQNTWRHIQEEMKDDGNLSGLSYSSAFDQSDSSRASKIEQSDRLFFNKIAALKNGKNIMLINDVVYLQKYYFIGILRPSYIVHSCFSDSENIYERFLFEH